MKLFDEILSNFKLGNKQLSKEQFDKVLLYSPSDKSALEGITYVSGDEKKNVNDQ